MHIWKRDSLASLLSPIGSLVEVDELTESLSMLEFARVKIHTAKLECIKVAWDMSFNNSVHGIRIVEEWPVIHPTCNKGCFHGRDEDIESSNWSFDGTVRSDAGSQESEAAANGEDEEVEGPGGGNSYDHGLMSVNAPETEMPLRNHLENWLPFNDCTSGSGMEVSINGTNDDPIIRSNIAESDNLTRVDSNPRICLDVGHARGALGGSGMLSSFVGGLYGLSDNFGPDQHNMDSPPLGPSPVCQISDLGTLQVTQNSPIPDLMVVPFAASHPEDPPPTSPSPKSGGFDVSPVLAVGLAAEGQNPAAPSTALRRKVIRLAIRS